MLVRVLVYVSVLTARRRWRRQLLSASTPATFSTKNQCVVPCRWVPLLVALVNGGSPLLISILIILPLWLARNGVLLPVSPLYLAVGVASVAIFVLGVLLGRIADVSWVLSGARTVAVATLTVFLIYLFTG